MKLGDIIRLARRIVAESPCVAVREEYVANKADQIDQLSETVLSEFSPDLLGEPLRMVAVKPVLEWVRRVNPGLEIRFQAVNGSNTGRSIYGFVAVEGHVATVVYSDAMNLCWTRFTLVKELMHLCLGATWLNEGGREALKAEQLLMAAQNSRDVCPTSGDDLDEETAALFLALEVLVPWRLRSQYAMMCGMFATTFQQAKAFLIPVNMMELFSSRRCGGVPYCELSAKINSTI